MKRIIIDHLTFQRAGTDVLQLRWSAHVKGVDLQDGEQAELERFDGSTFLVESLGQEDGWTHIAEVF